MKTKCKYNEKISHNTENCEIFYKNFQTAYNILKRGEKKELVVAIMKHTGEPQKMSKIRRYCNYPWIIPKHKQEFYFKLMTAVIDRYINELVEPQREIIRDRENILNNLVKSLNELKNEKI